MGDTTVGDVLDKQCQEGEDVMVCEFQDGADVLEKPDNEALNAPATEQNIKTLREHKSISQ
jgi:hypothetical protein